MLEFNTLLFLLLVALGAFIQTVSGFAMGLIIIAGATLLGLEAVAFSAAVIGIISLVNSSVALRTSYRKIDGTFLKWIAITLIPGLVVGVWLLEFLSDSHEDILRALLGLLIIVGGLMLMARPVLQEARSAPAATAFYGVLGGIFGGLYSAGGAALAYHLYRQPAEVAVVRATLLAVFVISTAIRTVFITLIGQMSMTILITSVVAVPLVVLVTEASGRLLPHISDAAVRRLVFVLMTLMGAALLLLPAAGASE